MKEKEIPLHILKGKNYWRYLSITILAIIISLSIYSIQTIGYVMILVIISAAIGIIIIPFPFLYLFKDHFAIENRNLIKKFSDYEIYRFDEIKEIEFVKGYIKWSQLIFQSILGKGAYGGFSKSDQMIVKFHNNKIKIIYRFGSRKKFEDMVNKLQRKVSISTHKDL